MSLHFIKETTPMSNRIAPRRLYLTADKSEVVGENDERAAFLLAGKGGEIPDDVDVPAELLEPEPDETPADDTAEETADDTGETEKPEGKPAAKRGKSATTPEE